MEVRGVPDRTPFEKAQEMIRCRPVAMDGLHRRAEHLLMMLQPAPPQFADGDGFKAQRGGRADLQLGIDLCGELACRVAIRTDTRPISLALVTVA
jgi:hypothetical protein